ncbi:hypothetical protein AAE02nite_48270 [Adhaeribacter aerolatus]|uniref:Uncharacterized protein n=1 Tax=Adhaeribacter aerolatus TaxID=670289 RepID=A0A512B5B5_9BACT|nr:hypothetical protein [Adhaeribacter aerolatus]GEO07163.1 hypothetical protein AAE02nite_48270 [Adhaeribacter aerolatus]
MNRKYLVDSTTHEYLCVALKDGKGWVENNQKSLKSFMSSRPDKNKAGFELLSGEFNDNAFFEKWIRNGTNFLFQY